MGHSLPDDRNWSLAGGQPVLISPISVVHTDWQAKRLDVGLMINEPTEVMRRYNLKVPMNLMLLLKTLVMVFDVAVWLDPKFSFGGEVTPYLRKLADSNVLSAGYMKRASNSLLEAVDAAFDLPRNVNLMLKRLSTGTIRLEVVDTDLKKLQMALDRASDKIMIGLVVAALVVGSSLVLQASPVALPKEIMWVAVLGYTAAGTFVGFTRFITLFS